ncbi:MAG: hypothetical protein AAFX76_14355 [Planctomycetota bacterium]
MLAGMGGGRGQTWGTLGVAVLGVVLAAGQWETAWSQTRRVPTANPQARAHAPFWLMADALPEPHGTGVMQPSELDRLPPDARVMVVGDNQALFYLRPDFVYASAFDPSPLTPILRTTDDPDRVAQALRDRGVTHLWVGFSELNRLHATYGFDPEVTADAVARLAASWGWRPPRDARVLGSELIAVPANTSHAAPENP